MLLPSRPHLYSIPTKAYSSFRLDDRCPTGSLTAASTLTPHPDTPDGHAPSIARTPGRVPLICSFPELSGRDDTLISPWLIGNTVLEESVGCTDCNVEDEVEGLIEGSV